MTDIDTFLENAGGSKGCPTATLALAKENVSYHDLRHHFGYPMAESLPLLPHADRRTRLARHYNGLRGQGSAGLWRLDTPRRRRAPLPLQVARDCLGPRQVVLAGPAPRCTQARHRRPERLKRDPGGRHEHTHLI